MRKLHLHDGGIDGIICDEDDCSYVKRDRARKRHARWLAFSICIIAAIMSAIAIASEHRYGLVFLALFLILVPIMCDEVLADRTHSI
jgi:predicted nucleic acid-binding Zn ribbon protein